jgi:hypothetical protein
MIVVEMVEMRVGAVSRWHLVHALLVLFALMALEAMALVEQVSDSWPMA